MRDRRRHGRRRRAYRDVLAACLVWITLRCGTQTMINISLNNEPKQIAGDTLLSDALIQWGFGEIKIAVAINSEFVPRSTYTSRQLQDGDQIDIVKPVGGG